MAMEVADWLRALGLAQYEPAFRENEITAELLPSLTAEDLRELGVIPVGHRRRLLDAAALLRAAESERRQMTVMFSDLVGSTALAARLDPEDLQAVIGAYQACAAEMVGRFDGSVARYLGDGVLAYFGHPHAHEDDAERAVRAALALIEAIGRVPAPEPLQIRIGISTGMVVMYDAARPGGGYERSIVGEAPNLAARLQALAEPNTVVIGPNARRLLGDLFEYRELGTVEVKGFAKPVYAFEVVRPSAVASRFEALHGQHLTPLVGRREEIELLLQRWRQAKSGEGQVAVLSGEPGIGKSRIAAAVAAALADEPHARLRYFCSPHHQDSALHPVILQLERAAGFARGDDAAAKRAKLDATLAPLGLVDEHAALIAALLSLPEDDRHPLPAMSPQARKEKTLAALLARLEGLARQRPLLMIVEDVHWIDPSSLSLLTLAVEQVPSLPMLLVITARRDFVAGWTEGAHVMTLSLTRLDRNEVATLANRVAGDKALPDEVLEQILAHTDGVPLFIEELTRTVLEGGLLQEREGRYTLAGPLPPLAIPTTLHASLMARLDRLAPARELAQIAAAIGRDFGDDLIKAVTPWPERQVDAALAELIAAQLVFRHGAARPARYSFKHALVQDAAYDTLLRGKRQALHARIAEVLERRFPDTAAQQPELLAQHLAQAGAAERAIGLWLEAARRMLARGAVAEAVRQLQKGVALIAARPETPERQRQELDLQIALGGALIAAQGYTAPETDKAFTRARDLCERVGETSQLLRAVWGQFTSRFVGGAQKAALTAAEEMLALAERRGDVSGRIMAQASCGSVLLFLGRLRAARAAFEAALAIDAVDEREAAFLYGQSGRVLALAYLGLDLMLMGFVEAAERNTARAIEEARALAHPTTLCFAHSIATRVAFARRDRVGLVRHAAMVRQLSDEQGLGLWQALGEIYHGWTAAYAGRDGEAVALIRRGLARYRAGGARLSLPLYLLTLAMAQARAGDNADAATIVEAQQASEIGEERWMDAEIHRVAADILLVPPQRDPARAEAELLTAMAIAAEQGARLWHLRAATCLARLWGEQGRRGEGRDLLAPICDGFSEGSDLPDLAAARALIAARG
jgi:class 3 adenylate cyclase/predicted ATPase